MKSLILKSPAKINLYLKITAKRDDGFHELKTIFQRIDLCDELEFQVNSTGDINIQCNNPQVPCGSKNLIYKIAKLVQQDNDVSMGVDVKLNKIIPVAAGLAGGSSNAATTLKAVNQLWNLNLSHEKLGEYASSVGSDLNFFLENCSWALGTGRGEKIQPLNISSKFFYLIVVPRVKMYTHLVFGSFKMQLTKPDDNVNILTHYLQENDLNQVGSLVFNDLEKPILELQPRLLDLKKKLQALGSKAVAFSGSGPSIFAMADSAQDAKRMKDSLDKRYNRVFMLKTL